MTPVASSSSAGLKNSGQSHSFYDQQGPSDPSDYAQHHYTQANDIFQLRMFFWPHYNQQWFWQCCISEHYTDSRNVNSSVGPSAPASHHDIQSNAGLPSGMCISLKFIGVYGTFTFYTEQFRVDSPLALVVIPGVPASNIPIDLANALRNMLSR